MTDQTDGLRIPLRDYFAAAVLPAVYASCGRDMDFKAMASVCYELADALVAQRDKDEAAS